MFFLQRVLSVELVKRLRALTLTLLPVEVDPNSLKSPTSGVITPEVIAAYRAAGGNFDSTVSVLAVHDICDDEETEA